MTKHELEVDWKRQVEEKREMECALCAVVQRRYRALVRERGSTYLLLSLPYRDHVEPYVLKISGNQDGALYRLEQLAKLLRENRGSSYYGQFREAVDRAALLSWGRTVVPVTQGGATFRRLVRRCWWFAGTWARRMASKNWRYSHV